MDALLEAGVKGLLLCRSDAHTEFLREHAMIKIRNMSADPSLPKYYLSREKIIERLGLAPDETEVEEPVVSGATLGLAQQPPQSALLRRSKNVEVDAAETAPSTAATASIPLPAPAPVTNKPPVHSKNLDGQTASSDLTGV